MTITQYIAHVQGIVDSLEVKTGAPGEYAAHYTNVNTPRLLMQSDPGGSLRQYDGDYMNDPQEGRYLVDVMIAAAEACTHQHKRAFVQRLARLRSAPLLHAAYGKATFLSCWTHAWIKAGQEETSDSLNHWRFYGADGSGASLAIPLDHLCKVFPNSLYRVVYGTEARGGGRGAAQRPVTQVKQGLTDALSALRRSYDNAMSDLEEVVRATHPLLFLFKSSAYVAENEVRSIMHKPDYGPGSGVEFDDRDPKRAYVNGVLPLIVNDSIILYGPKANHHFAIEAMGMAAKLGLSIQVFKSALPYR